MRKGASENLMQDILKARRVIGKVRVIDAIYLLKWIAEKGIGGIIKRQSC